MPPNEQCIAPIILGHNCWRCGAPAAIICHQAALGFAPYSTLARAADEPDEGVVNRGRNVPVLRSGRSGGGGG